MLQADTGRDEVPACPGWLMTSVSSWGENEEDAFDQGLVELGLGDARLIRVEGAMLPMGFEAVAPEPLGMGILVECHLAIAHAWDGKHASAGVAWANCKTPEGDECGIVATLSTEEDAEETEMLLRRNLQRKLASRDLEVITFDIAVDEVTAGQGHHGVAIAALILPETMVFQQTQSIGRVRGGLTRSASDVDMSGGGSAVSNSPKPSGPRRDRKGDDDSISFDL